MSSSPRSPHVTGLLYGIAAYGWWGFVAVYFRSIGHVPAPEILAHRIVWSVLVLALIVAVKNRWGSIRGVLRERRMVVHLALSTVLIAINWFVFIWAVGSGHLLQASLGYYINPLVNVLFGYFFLGERLRPTETLSVAIAASFEILSSNADNQQLKINEKILSAFESSTGILWIGTSGSGFVKYDPSEESFTVYSASKGLTSTVIYGILEDNDKNLWLSTDDGLFLFNTLTEKFTQFMIEDGVQSLEFSGGAYFKDSDGFMYFGGINGFNYFHPDSITISQYTPSVVITKIKVMDVEIKGEPEELISSYDQNFISIEFSALDFYSPKRNKYSYFLEGFQKSGISTDGSNRTAAEHSGSPLVMATHDQALATAARASGLRVIGEDAAVALPGSAHSGCVDTPVFPKGRRKALSGPLSSLHL